MQDYKSVCIVVSGCDTWLAHRHTDRQLLTGYTISSARWAKYTGSKKRSTFRRPVTWEVQLWQYRHNIVNRNTVNGNKLPQKVLLYRLPFKACIYRQSSTSDYNTLKHKHHTAS